MDSVSVEFKPNTSGTIRTCTICRSPYRRTKVQSCLKIHSLSSKLSAEGRPPPFGLFFWGLGKLTCSGSLKLCCWLPRASPVMYGTILSWETSERLWPSLAPHCNASFRHSACLPHGSPGTGPGMSPERGVSKKEKIDTVCLPGNMSSVWNSKHEMFGRQIS